MDRRAADVFLSFPRAVTGIELELSQMGIYMENLDLVCENLIVHTGGQTMAQL